MPKTLGGNVALNCHIPVSLRRRLRLAAATRDVSMRQIIVEALEARLDKLERNGHKKEKIV